MWVDGGLFHWRGPRPGDATVGTGDVDASAMGRGQGAAFWLTEKDHVAGVATACCAVSQACACLSLEQAHQAVTWEEHVALLGVVTAVANDERFIETVFAAANTVRADLSAGLSRNMHFSAIPLYNHFGCFGRHSPAGTFGPLALEAQRLAFRAAYALAAAEYGVRLSSLMSTLPHLCCD